MAVDIALDDEEMQRRMQQVAPLAQMPTPAGAPVQPSTMDQAKSMGTQMVLERGLTAGVDKATPYLEQGFDKVAGLFSTGPTVSSAQATGMADIAAKTGTLHPGAANAVLGTGTPLAAKAAGTTGLTAGTTAAGTGGMAALGTAMPYIGAGLLAGKALGFFSQGGFVGPLAKVEYKSNGGEVYKLSYGGPISKGV